jgi:PilZ domain
VAKVLHLTDMGARMGERRKAKRYAIYLPLQVCMSRKSPNQFFTAHLRDISRSGIYFHSSVALEPGSPVELTFALPAENSSALSVLVRASAKALRITPLPGEDTPLYGVAATIDRIDFVRPSISHAA